jgi:heterodisulfide reductase subunit C
MARQLLFLLTLLITLGVFTYTTKRIVSFFRLTKPAFPVKDFGRRIWVLLDVAFWQTKILRRPVIGFLHAVTFWGFCLILFGSVEMIIDGLAGTEHALKFLGPVYKFFIGSGDVFALLIAVAVVCFLGRRIFLHIRRFSGIEMKKISHIDANIALSLILFLMISLLGMNASYYRLVAIDNGTLAGIYPVGGYLSLLISGVSAEGLKIIYEICWWTHILTIFVFANMLPYSKHFHVFMSLPNVFLSRLEPLGKLPNMDNITREVRQMLDPAAPVPEVSGDPKPERFGVRDCEDLSWKNYLDSLACTECGRCTSACPANITGKLLSPRKILMDARARMKVKGPHLVKEGLNYSDMKSLVRDYISEEELWACTTCNACAKECPVNINHPTLIVDMRRYLVMEEGSAPGKLKVMFNNIENNGAPWQFSAEDRMLWAKDLEIKIN